MSINIISGLPMAFVFILTGFMLTQFSTTLILPLLPELQSIFHTTTQSIMLLLSWFFTGYALGQLTWGSLSDRFGRKPMMLISLVFYTVFSLSLIFLKDLWLFNTFYALLGFQAAAYTSVGNAILKDIYQDKVGIYISYIGIGMASGAFLGPFFGGQLLYHLGWKSAFLALALTGFLALLGFYFCVPESHNLKKTTHIQNSGFFRALAYLKGNLSYLIFISILGLSFGTYYAYLDASPFIFKNYLNISIYDYSLTFPLIGLAFFLGAITVSIIVRRIKVDKIVLFGLIMALVGALGLCVSALIHTHHFTMIFFTTFIMVYGLGVLVPANKIGSMLAVNQFNGTASSMMKFIQTLFTVILVSAATLLHSSGSIVWVSLLFVLVILAGIFLVAILNTNAKKLK